MLHTSYNIRIIRGITRLNQTDFGDRFGATLAMQKSYESGKAQPDDLYLQRLSEFTRVPEDDLKRKKLKEKDIGIKVEFEENVSREKIIKLIADVDSFLVNKIIKQDAMLETILEVLAEQQADRKAQPVTKLLSELVQTISNKEARIVDELKRVGG